MSASRLKGSYRTRIPKEQDPRRIQLCSSLAISAHSLSTQEQPFGVQYRFATNSKHHKTLKQVVILINMEKFEAFLDNATSKANMIPGAVMAVVDQHGMQQSF